MFFSSVGTIAARLVDENGEPTGQQVTVSTGTAGSEPQAVRLSNGNIVVTWQEGPAEDGAVLGRIYTPDLTPIGNGVLTFASDGFHAFTQPEIAASTDGSFYVASAAAPNGVSAGISVKKFNAAGEQIDTILYTAAGKLDQDPSVAVLANGNVAVAWERQTTNGTEVWYRIYDSGLNPVTEPELLDATGTINADVDVSARPDGTFTISYADNFAGGATNVTTYVMTAAGTPITYRVTAASSGANEHVSVATSVDGYQVVVNEDHSSPNAWDVGASILTPSGSVIAVDSILQGGGGYQYAPSVAWVDSSTVQLAYAATISASENDGSGSGIAVSRFGVLHTQMGDDSAETIRGDGLRDVMNGFGGADSLYGYAGNDSLSGGEGNDHLHGGAGADQLDGGEGLDYARYDDANYGNLVINLSNASLNTGAAAGDTFSGIECLVAGAGNDTVVGDANANRLFGMGGNDIVRAGVGIDYLDGGDGNDHLYGGAGADTIVGGEGLDYARYDEGNYGNLTIRLDAPGANTGAAAGDTYSGIECIVAGSGNDTVFGDGGANRLFGMGGGDVIDGRAGSDFLEGGAGSDGFRFSTALGSTNIDTIADFQHGVDSIMLHGSIFTGIGPTLTTNEFGATSGAGRLIIYQQSTGYLFFDEGGAGVGAGPQRFATVTPGTVLDVNDFVVV